MRGRILCVFALAIVCASCGGSSSSGSGPTPLPLNETEQVPGLMTTGRVTRAVTLKSGDVLEVGGFGSLAATYLASGEVYHPGTNSFTLVSNQLAVAANRVCLAALNDGTALEAGGLDNNGDSLSQAEIYNPSTNSFVPTSGTMTEPRYGCTATTLQDGTVLIAGGDTNSGSEPESTTDTAEIYNPSTGTFTPTTGTMVSARAFHTAVLLGNGEVLLAGGILELNPLTSAELYNPSSGTFTATGSLNTARLDFGAILLADGRALEVGGSGESGVLDTAEIYDVGAGAFSLAANTMSSGRAYPSVAPLPNGNALVAGGNSVSPQQQPTDSADVFDAATNSFTPTASLHIGRQEAAAVVLPNGDPIVLGGIDFQGTAGGNYEPSGEIYDPTAGTFTVTGGLNSLRIAFAANRLHDGRVLIAGGATNYGLLDTAEVFDPKTGYFTPTANTLDTNRVSLNVVTLNDGDALVANGSTGTTAELFNPKTMTLTPTKREMTASRAAATATLLNDGTVLIAGGLDLDGNSLATAEIYRPDSQTFTLTKGNMTTPRALHTATLLDDGDVLIAGGSTSQDFSGGLDTAEIYDPSSQKFTAIGSTMSSVRASATANLLDNGDVLIAGGTQADGTSVATADIFDPQSRKFHTTSGDMSNALTAQSAVTLPDGRVMVAGGSVVVLDEGLLVTTTSNTVDFYDPASETFSPAVAMLSSRDFFTAVLLTSGKVLIPAGRLVEATGVGIAALETAEIYTP